MPPFRLLPGRPWPGSGHERRTLRRERENPRGSRIRGPGQSAQGAKRCGPHLLSLPRARRCPADPRAPLSTRHPTGAAGGSRRGALWSLTPRVSVAGIAPRPLPSQDGSRIAALLRGFWSFALPSPATHIRWRLAHPVGRRGREPARGAGPGSGKVWKTRR